MDKTNSVLPRIVDSVLGAVPVVGSGMQNAYDAWRQKNINTAREVLLSNIRQGDVEQMHQDEFFSMLARFSRSVQEGVAKSNLILMARLISGIGKVDKTDGKAETFSQYASMLESLTYEEIVFLSECIKAKNVISGKEELKQNLQQKGLFVWGWHTSISNKSDTFEPVSMSRIGRILRDEETMTSAGRLFRSAFGEPQKKQEPIPYEVNTSVEYQFSEKLNRLLETYGNLWENISLWGDKKEANNE